MTRDLGVPFGVPPGATYDVDGPLDAPAVVFLHGTRLTRAMWAAQMADLADAYRVVGLDLPGHGALATVPFTLDVAADQVAAIITAAVPARTAVVVGLSLGGYVAMRLAARHPERVAALVLSGCTAEPVAWRSAPYRALAWVFDHVGDARLDRIETWWFRARFPPSIAEPIVRGGFWYHGGAGALRALVGHSFIPDLAAFDGPTLFLDGACDVLFRLSGRQFARAARRGRRVQLAGATHLANLDRPAAYSAAVRRFVASLEPRP